MIIKGIDISTYQRDIDYNAVIKDDIKFAILRIGYTGYGAGKNQAKDALFETHYNGFKKVGMPLGGYFFGRGVSAEEGKKEANYVLSIIKGKTFEYPIFYDTEDTYYQAKATKAQNTAACKAFCDTIKAAGYKTGIYSSTSWYKSRLNDNELTQYDHWVAQYNVKVTYAGKYTMWQYSSKGKVKGINGNVDVNKCYVDYVKKEDAKTPTKPANTQKPVTNSAPAATNKNITYKAGDKVILKNADFYSASTSSSPVGVKRTGEYYIWDNNIINGRIRITSKKEWANVANKVTAWVYTAQINIDNNNNNNKPATQTSKPTVSTKKDTFKTGDAITLKKGKLYLTSTSKTYFIKTATYYIYDGKKINGRYRVTNKKSNCGKTPIGIYVSGWIAG